MPRPLLPRPSGQSPETTDWVLRARPLLPLSSCVHTLRTHARIPASHSSPPSLGTNLALAVHARGLLQPCGMQHQVSSSWAEPPAGEGLVPRAVALSLASSVGLCWSQAPPYGLCPHVASLHPLLFHCL